MENIGPNGSLDKTRENERFLRALLQVRNTPDPDCGISPSEVFSGYETRFHSSTGSLSLQIHPFDPYDA